MKIYTGNDDSVFEWNDVEFECSKIELDTLIKLLLDFQNRINQYLEEHSNETISGFTHMHYSLNNPIWKRGDKDIVFYVDLGGEDNNILLM